MSKSDARLEIKTIHAEAGPRHQIGTGDSRQTKIFFWLSTLILVESVLGSSLIVELIA
jgi:hypothetical protein